MPLTTLTLEDLYSELSDLARDQGIDNKESWDELIDEIVEGHLDLGELDLDQDTEGMKDLLRGRWEAYKKESAVTKAEEDEVIEETSVLVDDKADLDEEEDDPSREEGY